MPIKDRLYLSIGFPNDLGRRDSLCHLPEQFSLSTDLQYASSIYLKSYLGYALLDLGPGRYLSTHLPRILGIRVENLVGFREVFTFTNQPCKLLVNFVFQFGHQNSGVRSSLITSGGLALGL